MLKFTIKTHKKGATYKNPHIFILNKGLNSGKPSQEPFTNSFVIIFENPKDLDNIKFTAYALWKTKFWHPFLCGSVIPFLRLNEVKKEFTQKVNQEIKDHEEHLKIVKNLKILEQSEKNFIKNLNLINDIRKVILHRYCNK